MNKKIISLLVLMIFILSSVSITNAISLKKSKNSSNMTNKLNSEYDMIIITNQDFKSITTGYNFHTLKDAHEQKDNFNVLIKTIEEIYNEYEGAKNHIKIRNFLKDIYVSSIEQYVLIGGDYEIIPAKMSTNVDWQYDPVPTDFYYSILDDEYDQFLNSVYDDWSYWDNDQHCERFDMTFNKKVYVGRASISNEEELNNFVYKTIKYINIKSDKYYLRNIMMAGMKLDNTWGGTLCDDLIDECNKDGYTTQGFPSNDYIFDKIYDRDIPVIWSSVQLINKLQSKEHHFLLYNGHSYPALDMRLLPTQVKHLNNNELFFVFSDGCLAGKFDEDDCMAEYWTVHSKKAAFAGVWNTGVGWSNVGGQRCMREFFDAIFNEGITKIGKALYDSKYDNIPSLQNEWDASLQDNMLFQNLFGDPAVSFIEPTSNRPPNKPTIEGQKNGASGEEYIYTAETSDPDGDNIEYYLFDWGDGNNTGWQSNSSVSHIWTKNGIYEIKVRAKDEHGAESEWGTLKVAMPKTKSNKNILRFFDNHQLIFSILQNLLKKLSERYFF